MLVHTHRSLRNFDISCNHPYALSRSVKNLFLQNDNHGSGPTMTRRVYFSRFLGNERRIKTCVPCQNKKSRKDMTLTFLNVFSYTLTYMAELAWIVTYQSHNSTISQYKFRLPLSLPDIVTGMFATANSVTKECYMICLRTDVTFLVLIIP
jgi:hypothetical protein